MTALLLLTLARAVDAHDAVVRVGMALEEGKPMLVATVTRDGAPVEGALLSIGVRRTFGVMVLGEEETLDDGTAGVPFPEGLPGDRDGGLVVIAEVVDPEDLAGTKVEGVVPGGRPSLAREDPFPRDLWAPRAPAGLIGTISVLLGIVWSAYAWTLFQLFRIFRETRREGGAP